MGKLISSYLGSLLEKLAAELRRNRYSGFYLLTTVRNLLSMKVLSIKFHVVNALPFMLDRLEGGRKFRKRL